MCVCVTQKLNRLGTGTHKPSIVNCENVEGNNHVGSIPALSLDLAEGTSTHCQSVATMLLGTFPVLQLAPPPSSPCILYSHTRSFLVLTLKSSSVHQPVHGMLTAHNRLIQFHT